MRRLLLASAFALAPLAALAASLSVPANHSIMVTLPTPAHNVFLGSPDIADVAMSDDRHVVVTGKKPGVTNMIVTDIRGRTVFDREVVVGINGGNHVALIAGGQLQSYACAPMCEQVGFGQAPVSSQPATTTTTTTQSTSYSAANAAAAAGH